MIDFITNLLGPLFTIVLVVLLVRAFLGIRGRVVEGPECRGCGYNRTGLPNESPCPECGAEQKYPGSVLHIRKRRTARSAKRIAVDLLMIVGVVGLAYGLVKLDDYRLGYYRGFIDDVRDGDLAAMRAHLDRYPELAEGRFRYDGDVNDPGGPLVYAVHSDSPDKKKMIELLLDHGADPSVPRFAGALRYAIETNDHALAVLLFDKGLFLEASESGDNTDLLEYAAGRRGCDLPIIKLMLAHGAAPNRYAHRPPIAEALFRRDKEQVIDALLDAGADPNLEDHQGYTPIFIAVQHGRVDGVKLMIDAGADLNVLYADRMSPLDQAYLYIDSGSHRGQDHEAIAKLLEAHGAKRAEQIKQDIDATP